MKWMEMTEVDFVRAAERHRKTDHKCDENKKWNAITQKETPNEMARAFLKRDWKKEW